MEESKDQIHSIPIQRQHSVKLIIEKLKNSFAMKFENPIIERTSDSIAGEVTNNMQVLHSLSENIKDDLVAGKLSHLSRCVAQIQDFTEYMVKMMARTVTNLSESNSLLLKGRTGSLANQTTLCTICAKQVEEIRLKTLRDKLESMNVCKGKAEPNIKDLYGERERLSFEQDDMSAFETIIRQLISRRNTVLSLNNDRTISQLQDVLKTLCQNGQSLMEAEFNEDFINFQAGKEIISQLYDELSKNVKDIAKKDVMPIAYKLSLRLMEVEKIRLKKNRKSIPCQTDFNGELKRNIQKKISVTQKCKDETIQVPKLKREDHCSGTHRRSGSQQENIAGRFSLTNGLFKDANQTRISNFRKKNTCQYLISPIQSSKIINSEGDSRIIFRRETSQKSTQFDASVLKNEFAKFKQQEVQTTESGFASSTNLFKTRNAPFLKQSYKDIELTSKLPETPVSLTAIRKTETVVPVEIKETIFTEKEVAENKIIDSLLEEAHQIRPSAQHKTFPQNIVTSITKLQKDKGHKRNKDSNKSTVDKVQKIFQTNPNKNTRKSQITAPEVDYKLRKKTLGNPSTNKENRMTTEQSKLASQQNSILVSIGELNLNNFSKERSQIAKISKAMSMSKAAKEKRDISLPDVQNHQNSVDDELNSSMVNKIECQLTTPKNRQQTLSTEVCQANPTDISLYLGAIAKKLRTQYPSEFGMKVSELLVYALSNRDWICRVELARVLEKLYPAKYKDKNDQLRLKSQSTKQSLLNDKVNKSKEKNHSIRQKRGQLKRNREEIQSLFKPQANRPFFISQAPQLSLHKESVLKLPSLSKAIIESFQSHPSASIINLMDRIQLSRQDTVNLIRSDQLNDSNVRIARPTVSFLPRSRRDPYNNFTMEDLDMFGGLLGSQEFQAIFTKNSMKKRIVLAGCENSQTCKNLATMVYNHLQSIRESSKIRYQCIKSFLRYPYQTVCNDYVGLEVSQHMSLFALEEVFGAILSIHSQCSQNTICGHIEGFLHKIGLSLESIM